MRKSSRPANALKIGLVVVLVSVVGTEFNALSATKKRTGKAQTLAAQTSKGTNSQNNPATNTGMQPMMANSFGQGGMDMGGMMSQMMNMCPMMRRRGSPNFEPIRYGYDIVDAKDYRAFDLTEPRPELCETACDSEARCKAYTYTKPGTYNNPNARCWLKETQGRFVTHANAISAVKK